MYLGRIVEEAPALRSRFIAGGGSHPYTRALLASTPEIRPGEPTNPALGGEPPSPTDPPDGCPFHPRCPVAETRCREVRPEPVEVGPGHRAACHLAEAAKR